MTISNGSEYQTLDSQNKSESDESWAIKLINECKLEKQEAESLLNELRINPQQSHATTVDVSDKHQSKPGKKNCSSSNTTPTAIEIQMMACARKKQANLLKPKLPVKKTKRLKSLFSMS